MPNLDSPAIKLGTTSFKLAQQEVLKRLGMLARNWKAEHQPVTAPRIPRVNVRKGDIEGEWVCTYDDWSKGVAGDLDNTPGTAHRVTSLDTFTAGVARLIPQGVAYTLPNEPPNSNNFFFVWYIDAWYLFAYQYCFKLYGTEPVLDEDFRNEEPPPGWGSDDYATGAAVFDNALVVGFGASRKLASRASTGTWTLGTEDVYADYLTVVDNVLWKGYYDSTAKTATVASCKTGSNPLLAASWSSAISIGEQGTAITALNAYGERLAVSKGDGLYIGDASAIFPNVLDQFKFNYEPDNGRPTLVVGGAIFYAHKDGLIVYEGGRAEEIGLQEHINHVTNSDTNPGTRITALAPHGNSLWAATESTQQPWSLPTKVLISHDNGGTFTDWTTKATDLQFDESADAHSVILDGFEDAPGDATNHYLYVGYSANTFTSVYFDISSPNSTVSGLTPYFWNGAAWGSVDHGYDGTSVGGATFARSGSYSFGTPTGWAANAVNGTTAYWVRFQVTVVLDGNTRVAEVRVGQLAAARSPAVYRVRRRRANDVRAQSWVWQEYADFNQSNNILALAYGHGFPHNGKGALLLAERWRVRAIPFSGDAVNPSLYYAYSENLYYGQLTSGRDDYGMPATNKRVIDVTLAGTPTSTVTWFLDYRANDDTSWTRATITASSSSPVTVAVGAAGYKWQWRVSLYGGATDIPSILTGIHVRFRELPTFKREYTMLVEVADGQHVGHQALLNAGQQLTALRALVGTSTTLIDPFRTSQTVTIMDMTEVEAYQDANGYPAVLVEVKAVVE